MQLKMVFIVYWIINSDWQNYMNNAADGAPDHKDMYTIIGVLFIFIWRY
jgi:hypothetical protein